MTPTLGMAMSIMVTLMAGISATAMTMVGVRAMVIPLAAMETTGMQGLLITIMAPLTATPITQLEPVGTGVKMPGIIAVGISAITDDRREGERAYA